MNKSSNIKYLEALLVTVFIVIMYAFYIFATKYVGANVLGRPVKHIVLEGGLVFGVLHLMPPINRRYLDYRYKKMSFENLRKIALVVLGIFINSLALMLLCHVLFSPLALINKNISKEHFLLAEVILFLFLLLYTSVNHAIYYSKLFVARSSELDKAESQKLENDIKYLRAQFNPRLIQQTLEFVERYQQDNKPLARSVLEQFSNALRYKIYEVEKKEVSLQKELDSLESYIKLRAVVYQLIVDMRIDTVTDFYTIKPLLLYAIFDVIYDCSSKSTSITITGVNNPKSYKLSFDVQNIACDKKIESSHEFKNTQKEFQNSDNADFQLKCSDNNILVVITFVQN